MTVKERIIELPKIEDKRGNLSFAEEELHIPFRIARAYWIYNVPGGQTRGSHAFKNQEEVIISLSGSFDVVLDDGEEKRKYQLNRSYRGLYIPSKMWRSLENFSTNSLCLVLASMPYDENEYIRNYKDFKRYLKIDPFSIIADINKKVIVNTFSKKALEASVYDCSLIELPVIQNRRGNITPVHNSINIPFDIKRVFYVYDIPAGEKRGAHAHKSCHEFLIAASGSFEVELDDGINKRTIMLNRPMVGLHLPPGIWGVEKNYSAGAVCLVLTSNKFEEKDYIRNYSDFKKYRSNGDKTV